MAQVGAKRVVRSSGDRWCCVCNTSIHHGHYRGLAPAIHSEKDLQSFIKRQEMINIALEIDNVLTRTTSRVICEKCLRRAEKLQTLCETRKDFKLMFIETQKARGNEAVSTDETSTPTKTASGGRKKRLSKETPTRMKKRPALFPTAAVASENVDPLRKSRQRRVQVSLPSLNCFSIL